MGNATQKSLFENKFKSLKLGNKLKVCKIEREVEDVYNQGLSFYFADTEIKHPFACDGFINTTLKPSNKILKLIIEYKFNDDMKQKVIIAKLLVQVIFYLKRFEQAGNELPNVVMVGDINECFVMHVNDLLKYLDYNVDWSVAPSEAYKKCPDMIADLTNDESINPFVFWIDENFDFKSVIERIYDLCENVKRYVRVTEHNISSIFEYFRDRVIFNKNNLTANELVHVFVGLITNSDEFFLHPKKKNTLITPNGNIPVNSASFVSFFDQYAREYTPQERMNFTAIADRLLEDTTRRRQGCFNTPTKFVDFAHRMIEKDLGENWRDDYVVYDCCCYDSETEFCSDKGWKRFSDYTEGDKVLQFNNDMTASFVYPLEYIKYENEKGWCSFSNSQINFRVTPDHDLVVFNDTNKDKQGNIVVKKEKALSVMERAYHVKNVHTNVFKSFIYNGDVHVNEWILRLAVAINADGCFNKYRTLGNHKNRTKRNTRFTENDSEKRDVFVIAVKKERKKERCRFLLEEAGINYVSHDDKDGYTEFAFHFPFNPKEFPVEWYHLDKESKQIFLDEIFLWDGSTQKSAFQKDLECVRKTYFTTKKKDADLVNFLMSSSGYGVNYRVDYRTNLKPCYYVAMTKYTTAKLSNKSNKESFWKKEISNKEMCYCFRVPSGMLVVRRNNKVMICGNCGTGNLTRDYRFKELYCSTLDKGELELGSRYNPEAVKWQMDFLNDGDDCFDKGLIKAFEQNKPIVFFINPPYGRNGGVGKLSGTSESICFTEIRKQMNEVKMNADNLQHQFMFRIAKLVEKYHIENAYFALFSKPVWMTGQRQRNFLNYFASVFSIEDAYLFQASHFADVSEAWGISLTLWKSSLKTRTEPLTDYSFKLLDVLDDGNVDIIGSHTLYNTQGKVTGSNWVCECLKKVKTYDYPNLSSGLIVSKKVTKGRWCDNALGFMFNHCNSVYKNAQEVALFSSAFSSGMGVQLVTENFTRCTELFAARKLIEGNWINDKDEYFAPNESHPEYKRFEAESIVFSLFHNSSNQTSMRQITYKGKLYDIPNEFFWMSKETMMSLANEHHDDFMFNDARTSKERYVFTLLQKPEIVQYLSETAKQLLSMATEMTIKSMKYRILFESDHPDYHIHTWDAGYYQLKNLWKEYLPDDFKQFRDVFKQFGNELRPLVYELGFLRK